MLNVFWVMAIKGLKEDKEILIKADMVLAQNEEKAKQGFLLDNAAELGDVKDLEILARPF